MENKQYLSNIDGLRMMVIEYKDISDLNDADQRRDVNAVVDFYHWVLRQTEGYVITREKIKSLQNQIDRYKNTQSEKMIEHV